MPTKKVDPGKEKLVEFNAAKLKEWPHPALKDLHLKVFGKTYKSKDKKALTIKIAKELANNNMKATDPPKDPGSGRQQQLDITGTEAIDYLKRIADDTDEINQLKLDKAAELKRLRGLVEDDREKFSKQLAKGNTAASDGDNLGAMKALQTMDKLHAKISDGEAAVSRKDKDFKDKIKACEGRITDILDNLRQRELPFIGVSPDDEELNAALAKTNGALAKMGQDGLGELKYEPAFEKELRALAPLFERADGKDSDPKLAKVVGDVKAAVQRHRAKAGKGATVTVGFGQSKEIDDAMAALAAFAAKDDKAKAKGDVEGKGKNAKGKGKAGADGKAKKPAPKASQSAQAKEKADKAKAAKAKKTQGKGKAGTRTPAKKQGAKGGAGNGKTKIAKKRAPAKKPAKPAKDSKPNAPAAA
jgi:hypothetical protein